MSELLTTEETQANHNTAPVSELPPGTGTMTAMIATVPNGLIVTALIERAGKRTLLRFVEFFTVHISNANTRQAYARALKSFLGWCDERSVLDIAGVQPLHVAVWRIAQRAWLFCPHRKAAPRRHPRAVRLARRSALARNQSGRLRQRPSVLDLQRSDAGVGSRDGLPASRSSGYFAYGGLRDRAPIGLLTYTFARVSAAVAMRVEDYYPAGKRWRVRLHEKNGKIIDAACHHNLEEYLDEYIAAARIADDKKGPLFRAAKGRIRMLQPHAMTRIDVWLMIRHRAEDAEIAERIGCHTFRATGITAYLKNGGTIGTIKNLGVTWPLLRAGHAVYSGAKCHLACQF